MDTSDYGAYTGGGFFETWSQEGGTGGVTEEEAANHDVRFVQQATVGGQVVSPRAGSNFLESTIHFEKDYSVFLGNSGKNKSRWTGFRSDPANAANLHGGYGYDYDEEIWMGISLHLPSAGFHRPEYQDHDEPNCSTAHEPRSGKYPT